MRANKHKKYRGNSKSSPRLKPIAQAVTLVCAGMAGNSVYANVCGNGAGTTTISTDVSGDVCILDSGESLDVTLSGIIANPGTGSATILGVAVAATGGTIAGSITNAGTIRGFNTGSLSGGSLGLSNGIGIIIIDTPVALPPTSEITGITNNGGIIEGVVAGIAAFSGATDSLTMSLSSAYGIAIKSNAVLSGGISNNNGTIAGLLTATVHGTTASQAASVDSNVNLSARYAYGIYADNSTTWSGGLTNSGTIKGHAIIDALVTNVTGTVNASALFAYGIYANGVFDDGGLGISNNGGLISGKASATFVNTDVTTSVSGANLSAYSAYGIYLRTNADVAGSLTNSGVIEAVVSGVANITGMLPTATTMSLSVSDVYAFGYQAYGLLLVNDGVGGLFDNSGTVSGAVDLSIEVNNFKSIGTAYASAYSAYGVHMVTSGVDGSFSNSGTISGDVDVSVALNNVKSNKVTFSHDVSAYAYYGYGLYADVAPIGTVITDHLTNSGSITGSVSASVDWEGATGSISQVYASVEYAYGISLYQSPIAGSLINAGTISGDLTASINVVGDTAGSAVGSSANAQVYYAYGIYLSSSDIGGSLTNNAGIISASANASVSLENLASVTDSISGYAVSAYGLYAYRSNITGNITNSGTIAGEVNADIILHNIDKLNIIDISVSARYAYGIYLSSSDIGGSLTNNGGVIKGVATASVEVTDFTRGDYFDVIASSAYGIALRFADVTGNITNSGSISGEAYANVFVQDKNPTTAELTIYASASYAYGLTLENSTVGGDLDNSGTISATGVAQVTASDLDSLNSAFLSATRAYGIYMSNGDIDGGLTNSGTIAASLDARLDVSNVLAMTDEITFDVSYAYGVYAYQTPIGTLTTDNFTNNAGTISASLGARINLEGLTDSFSSISVSARWAYGVLLFQSPVAGSLINNGTISAEIAGTASVIGATTGSSPGLVGEDVEIDVAYAYGVYGNSSDIGGSLTNGGTISATLNGSVHLENMFSKSSSFSVSVTGAYGIYLNRSDITGDLSNSGIISGEANADITLRNVQYATSYLSVSATYAYGVFAQGTFATHSTIGAITNNGGTITGKVSATVDITDIREFYSPSATASYAHGIYLRYVDVGGISNTGTISGEASADVSIIGKNPATAIGGYVSASASRAFGLYLSSSDITGSLSNDGTISALVDASLHLEGLNSVASRISASASNAYGIYLNSSDIDVNLANTGTISGEAYADITLRNVEDVNNRIEAEASHAYGFYAFDALIGGSITNTSVLTMEGTASATVDVTGITYFRSAFATGHSAFGIAMTSSTVTGSLTNSGTLSAMVNADVSLTGQNPSTAVGNYANAIATEAYGVAIEDNSGITGNLENNSGIIQAIAEAKLDVQAVVTNSAYALASNIAGIRNDLSTITGNLVNDSGTISAVGNADVNLKQAGSGTNGWTFNARAKDIWGIKQDDLSVITGNINNSGVIEGIATATLHGATDGDSLPVVSASGSVYASANVDGINMQDGAIINGIGADYGLENSGTILGQATVTAAVSGFSAGAYARAEGVDVNGTGTTLTKGINNSGLIKGIAIANYAGASGTADADGIGIRIYTNGVIDGDINNTGTIEGVATATNSGAGGASAAGFGFLIQTGSLTGSIVNSAGGVISGTTHGISITNNASGSVTIVNEGEDLLGNRSTISSIYIDTGEDLDISGLGGITGEITGGGGNLTISGVGFTLTDDISGFTNASIDDLATLDLDENATSLTVTNNLTFGSQLNLKTTINELGENGSVNLALSGTLIEPTTIDIDIDASAAVMSLADPPYTLIDAGVLTTGIVLNTPTDNNIGFDFISSITAGDLVVTVVNVPNFIIPDGVEEVALVDFNFDSITIGGGTSGLLNQQSGTITTGTLTINPGGSFTQLVDDGMGGFIPGTGVLNGGIVTLGDGASLTLANQGAGVIDGASAGVGDLIFAGNYNTDSTVGATFALNNILVKDGATLTLDQNVSATTFTVGEGLSGIVNQIAGTVTVTDLVINAGGAYNQSGTGILNASTSTITIASGGTLTLTNQGTGAIDGAAAGQGALVFAGNYNTDAPIGDTNSLAVLTVNSGNTLTADQNIEAAAINVAGIINQSAASLGASTLTINSGGTYTQSGTGALQAGTIAISGIFNKQNTTSIPAATTISNGGLLLVANGFNHNGNLNVSGGSVDVGSVTVNVDGTFNLGAGATLSTTVNTGAANDAGKITVTGTTTVSANATVDISVSSNAVVADGTTYKIIDGPAGGSGVNVPLTITDDSTELNFIASTDGSDLLLTAELAEVFGEHWLLSRTRSPNALSGFNALRRFIDGDPELANAFASITTVEEFEAALQTLLPDFSRAIVNVTSFAGRSAVVSVMNRLFALRNGGMGFTGIAAGDHLSDIGLWLQAFGTTIDQDDRQGIAGFNADTYGLTIGWDKLVSDNLRLGGAFSLSGTDTKTKGIGKNLDVRNYQGTFFGSYQVGNQHLDASISYGNNSYDSTRIISVATLQRMAEAHFSGSQVILQGEYGQVYTVNQDLVISPYAGLYYSNLDIDGYKETGAGTVNLSVVGQSYESVESILGVSVHKEMETRNGTKIMPEAHVSWRHDFTDDIQVNSSTFVGGGGSFLTEGFTPASDSFNLGVSYSMYLENNIDIELSYDFEAKSNYKSHSGLINIRYNF